jgi:hypothetical protein
MLPADDYGVDIDNDNFDNDYCYNNHENNSDKNFNKLI